MHVGRVASGSRRPDLVGRIFTKTLARSIVDPTDVINQHYRRLPAHVACSLLTLSMLLTLVPLATALTYVTPFSGSFVTPFGPHVGPSRSTGPSRRSTPPLVRSPARAAVLMQSVAPADQSPAEQFSGLVRGDLSFQAVRTAAEIDTPGLAICSPDDCTTVVPAETVHAAKVGSYFGLWFVLSIGYAVCNKRVTNALPLPWCVATSTVLVGSVFVSVLWKLGLRETPQLNRKQLLALLPIGAFHAIGHAAGTLGTTYGSVSFAQVVKAAGPVYACALSAFVLRQAVSARVWLTLLPIIGGVGLATMKELSFAWGALGGAVVSDLALALRNVYSKQRMNKPRQPVRVRKAPPRWRLSPEAQPHQADPLGARLPYYALRRGGLAIQIVAIGALEPSPLRAKVTLPPTHVCPLVPTTRPAEERGDLSPANMFGVLTCLSTAVSLPFALLMEGRTAPAVWAASVAAVPGGAPVLLSQAAAPPAYTPHTSASVTPCPRTPQAPHCCPATSAPLHRLSAASAPPLHRRSARPVCSSTGTPR